MARRSLPVLLLNLNCEMLYVIEERLVAQGVDDAKANKVRQDLVRAMFDTEFVEMLFKPQPMYDQAQLMAVLEHFSRASIIRLNSKSLSKLFDLMIMTVKYQFSLCKCAKELLGITLTHLEVVRDTLHLDSTCRDLVSNAIRLVLERYGNISAGAWQRIRHVIGCVLQDKHTRVALFQQAQYQGQDGRFHLPRMGPAAPNARQPGKIMFGGLVKPLFRSKFTEPEKDIDYRVADKRGSNLGHNLYQLARQGKIEGVTVEAGPLTTIRPATEQPPTPQLKAEQEQPKALKNSNQTALQGLDLLARLVGGEKKGTTLFPLLLFSSHSPSSLTTGGNDDDEDDVLDPDQPDTAADVTFGGSHSVLHVEASSGRENLRDIMRELEDEDDEDDGKHKDASGDDLLAMMDAL